MLFLSLEMDFQLPVPEPNFSLENDLDNDETLQSFMQQSELMDDIDDDENMPLIDEGPSDDELEAEVRHTFNIRIHYNSLQ